MTYMLITQFQFKEVDDEKEYKIMEDFCVWLIRKMSQEINTKINRRKIQLRIPYLYKVDWIQWENKKKDLTVDILLQCIFNSISVQRYRKNIWKIQTNNKILIPGTYTSIDRFIRFLNYGDNHINGTGIFTKLEQNYRFHNLNSLWKLYCLQELGYVSDTKIITR